MITEIAGKTYKDFKLKDLIALQELLATKHALTPSEASIWLEMPLDSIYKLIKTKKVSAFHPFGIKSRWLIDVEETKKMIKTG